MVRLLVRHKIAVLIAAVALLSSGCGERRSEPAKIRDPLKLRMIGTALRNYYAQQGSMPGGVDHGELHGDRLSWRVHLLPLLERDDLFKEFDLKEGWDAPINKPLSGSVPEVFALVSAQGEPVANHEFITAIVSPNSAWTTGLDIQSSENGNTILLAAVPPADRTRPWSANNDLSPEDICDEHGVKKSLIERWGRVLVLCASGEVWELSADTTVDQLERLTTSNILESDLELLQPVNSTR